MVDEQDGAELTPGLTPEQESAVRHLLAEARHDEPIPATVVARLDRVLDHLGTEAASPAGPAVVELDTRRRRRTASRLLLAAAAVVVSGVAVGQVVGTGGLFPSSEDAGSGADSAATTDRQAAEAGGNDSLDTDEAGPSGEDLAPEATAGTALQRAVRDSVPVDLSSSSFKADVRKFYRETQLAKRSAVAASGNAFADSYLEEAQQFDCPPAAYGTGLLLPAYFDGEPAVLAFRPPVGSQRLAELLECGTAERLGDLALAFDAAD